jgi:MFS family permease
MRRPAFVRFWLSRGFSTLAFQMLAVAVGWQVYALTHSAFALGMVGLAQFLPMLALTLVVGHVADRYDRRRIIRICQFIEAAIAAFLALGSLGGWIGVPAIFTAVTLFGATRAFEGPSTQALVPALVPPAMISQATAWSSSANQTATILGPALGGLLYAFGPVVPYALGALLFLTGGVLASLIRMVWVPPPREKPTLASVLSGIRFIRSRPAILGCISLDLFAVLLGGATALLPVYTHDILHTGPWGLGVLRAGPAVGALAMSVVLARTRIRRRGGATMFAAVGVFGIATIVFGLSRSLPLSLVALAVAGAADVVSVVIRQTLVQVGTPDSMRGRVAAVNAMFIGTSNQLGEFESGTTAALFGTVPAVVLGGIGTIVVALLWTRLFPALRNVDALDAQPAEPLPVAS